MFFCYLSKCSLYVISQIDCKCREAVWSCYNIYNLRKNERSFWWFCVDWYYWERFFMDMCFVLSSLLVFSWSFPLACAWTLHHLLLSRWNWSRRPTVDHCTESMLSILNLKPLSRWSFLLGEAFSCCEFYICCIRWFQLDFQMVNFANLKMSGSIFASWSRQRKIVVASS